MLVTATLVLVGLRQGVRWAILHEIDTILEEDVEEIRLALADTDVAQLPILHAELERKAIGHRRHGWFTRLFDTSGQVTWSSRREPDQTGLALPRKSNEPMTRNHERIVQQEIASTRTLISTVQVGADLTFLDDDMSRIDRLVWLAVAILAVAAPLMGYWLAGRAAATVGEIIATAQKLEPSRLTDRLPIRGTHDELDQLAETINGLLDRLAKFVEQKREFLAHAAHDLRTPLAAIRSTIEVALEADDPDADHTELLIDVIEEATALETLVNQLLLISESDVDRMKVDVEPVAFSEVVQKSVDMFGGVAELSEIELTTSVDPNVEVTGNRHLLRQLVNNLVDNAIKYTPNGGRVNVTLTQSHLGRSYAVLRVSDNGIGISPDDVPKVFDRFYRADKSRTRVANTAGTGLGLSICRAVAEAHRGTIECESKRNQGTIMTAKIATDVSTK